MRRNITLNSKSLLTDITSVGSFSRVYTLVSIQAAFLRESLKTQFTLERSLPSVGPHVNLEVWLSAEASLANRTMIRFIPRVEFHVDVIRTRRG